MARPVAPRTTRVPDIRTGDLVLVLTGRDAGKRGTVERVVRGGRGPGALLGRRQSTSAASLDRVAVVVEGLNVAKRHTKPRAKQGRTDRQPRIQQGGILDIAQPIPASKVMIVCPHCSQPTRVRHAIAADGRSVRVCRNCGEVLTREARKS